MGKRHKKHRAHDEEHDSDDDSITVSKTAVWQGIAGIFAILFVASLFTGGFGLATGETTTGNSQQAAPSPTPSPSPGEEPTPSGDVDINLEGARTLGDPNAPVMMVEWSDFRCPFCQRFWEQTLPTLKEEYIETGQVFFVYKDFPVVGGEGEALASWCAEEQGMFWEFHDVLFENLQQGNPQNFERWAGELGMDTAEFRECFESERYAQNVARDAQEGRAFGVTGTPGFYINGELVAGAQPLQNFQQIIESQLN